MPRRERQHSDTRYAASKKKGMWMGGVPPLGYRAQAGKLFVIESEAEVIRMIFRRYAGDRTRSSTTCS